jgi:hypothetical protein
MIYVSRLLIRLPVILSAILIMVSMNGLAAQPPKLSKKQAQAIALKLHPGKVKSAELEKEKDIQMYSFDILTREGVREVGIDADSGKVVEDSVESPADEAKEKADEKAKKH